MNLIDDIFQLRIRLANDCTVQTIQRVMQGVDAIREETISDEFWDGVRYIRVSVETAEEDKRMPSLWVSCNVEEYHKLSELLRRKGIRGFVTQMTVNVNGNYVATVEL